jgi:predicted pyridoxine 5'-phosphate oxidase superfamily flavin-nucleotide-binding protein
MASVSETGWPYVQHRGGPGGFVRVIDQKTLGFPNFSGNRQFVSTGNLQVDDRVSLFFMDYPNKARLKLLGRVKTSKDPEILESLALEGCSAKIGRAFLIDVAAIDWNCPQHITPRFTAEDTDSAVAPLRSRIAELEAAQAR